MAQAGLKFGMEVKKMFFDRKAVVDAIGKAKVKALSKIGAFIRTSARGSMSKRKKSSAPGTSPSVHAGQLKKLLYFSYDPIAESVVIGPIAFRQGEAPALHEYGGTAKRHRYDPQTRRRSGPTYTAKYPARPVMGPALQRESKNPKLMDAWRDAVK